MTNNIEKPKYSYLLWRHAEYGPEDIVVTLNRDSLPSLLKELSDCEYNEDIELVTLLERDDRSLALRDDGTYRKGAHSLAGNGWGGLHLQVIELKG